MGFLLIILTGLKILRVWYKNERCAVLGRQVGDIKIVTISFNAKMFLPFVPLLSLVVFRISLQPFLDPNGKKDSCYQPSSARVMATRAFRQLTLILPNLSK